MPLITIFSAPKPFTNPHISTIQRNALHSWLQVGEEVEVLLIGQESGLAEIAKEVGVRQLPDVACNKYGTPLVSSIFSLAHKASNASLLAYINADMLILSDFLDAAKQVSDQLQDFLLIGQRWDMAVMQALDFSSGWEKRLQLLKESNGRLHPPAGSDFFVFPRHLFKEIPDFAIGRAGWDNWMIFHARQQNWPVVDATSSMTTIHQDHDYGHLPGGRPHYDLEESRQNMAMAGGSVCMYYILDCDYELVNGSIRPAKRNKLRLLRKIELWLTPKDGSRRGIRWALARRFRRWRRHLSGTLE